MRLKKAYQLLKEVRDLVGGTTGGEPTGDTANLEGNDDTRYTCVIFISANCF